MAIGAIGAGSLDGRAAAAAAVAILAGPPVPGPGGSRGIERRAWPSSVSELALLASSRSRIAMLFVGVVLIGSAGRDVEPAARSCRRGRPPAARSGAPVDCPTEPWVAPRGSPGRVGTATARRQRGRSRSGPARRPPGAPGGPNTGAHRRRPARPRSRPAAAEQLPLRPWRPPEGGRRHAREHLARRSLHERERVRQSRRSSQLAVRLHGVDADAPVTVANVELRALAGDRASRSRIGWASSRRGARGSRSWRVRGSGGPRT